MTGFFEHSILTMMNNDSRMVRFKRCMQSVGRKAADDRLMARSSSLAFSTVLSLVPLTMVIFSFGGFDQLGDRVIGAVVKILLPEGQDDMIQAFSDFTNSARRLGTWGSLLFLATAVLLFNSMERHLNDIFEARPHKGPVVRLGLYISSLVLISLLFGAGFGPITGLADAWREISSPVRRIFGGLLSILGVAAGLMILFGLLSAAKIKMKSSLLGALIGAMMFQGAKFGFTLWTTYSVRQSIINGSLVFIPLLLIWVNLAWIIILGAAEITYAHQNAAGRIKRLPRRTPAEETEEGWRLYMEIAENFHNGKTPPGIRELADQLSIDERLVSTLIKRFEENGLIFRVSGRRHGFVPSISPDKLPSVRVLSAISGWSMVNPDSGDNEAGALIRMAVLKTFNDKTIADFLERQQKA